MKKNVLSLSIRAWLDSLGDAHDTTPRPEATGRPVQVRFNRSAEDTVPFDVFLPAHQKESNHEQRKAT